MKLSGKNPIYERLRINPQSIRKIYLEKGFSDSAFVRNKAKKNKIVIQTVLPTKMAKIGRGKNNQGIMADVCDHEYIEYDDLLAQALKRKRTLVFLDNITDPQNLGAMLRSLGSMGRFSLILPTHNNVKITEAVLRIASGGDNHVPTSVVSNLNLALKSAKQAGFTIVGAVTKGAESIYDVKLPGRVGLVVGSEQKGIRPVVLNNLDIKVTIPMLVDTMSMNVAHATTVFCYEIIRQNSNRE